MSKKHGTSLMDVPLLFFLKEALVLPLQFVGNSNGKIEKSNISELLNYNSNGKYFRWF